MKQTAVEWLQETLECFGNKHMLEMSWATLDELFDQAKQMEKEQIKDAYRFPNTLVDMSSEEYYNETFKTNNNNEK